MDKIDQLFVRAAKTLDPLKRVHTVYRRFYGCGGFYTGHNEETYAAICHILLEVLGTKLTARYMVNELSPGRLMYYPTKRGYYEKVMYILISKIRLTERKEFEGLTTPRRFR
jgi:hypothetical protein